MAEAMYHSEITDLNKILDAFQKTWGSIEGLATLYVDGVELQIGMDGGENCLYRAWFDGESETFRVDRVTPPA